MSQSIYGVNRTATVSLDEHPEFYEFLETKPSNEDILKKVGQLTEWKTPDKEHEGTMIDNNCGPYEATLDGCHILFDVYFDDAINSYIYMEILRIEPEPDEEISFGLEDTIIDPDSTESVTEEQKRSLLDKLERIYDAIAEEAGMNVSYCESMNGSIFPHVVLLSLDEEEADLGSVDFLAENGFIFPKELQGKTREEFKKFLDEHERDILSEVESVAESDYKGRC